MIKESTHILENLFSCIDLVFASQRNLIVDSEAHPNLHPNCHHYAKFLNVKIIEELKLLQDCVLTLVICVDTNSNIVFKIH